MAIGSLVMAGRTKNDFAKSRYLKWRWQATIFTIFAMIGGVYVEQVLEDRWIRKAAKQRDVDISETDVGRSMRELYKFTERVKKFKESDGSTGHQVPP